MRTVIKFETDIFKTRSYFLKDRRKIFFCILTNVVNSKFKKMLERMGNQRRLVQFIKIKLNIWQMFFFLFCFLSEWCVGKINDDFFPLCMCVKT